MNPPTPNARTWKREEEGEEEEGEEEEGEEEEEEEECVGA